MARKLLQTQVMVSAPDYTPNSLTDSIAVSPDGKHVAVVTASSSGIYLLIYKFENGKLIRLPNPTDYPTAAMYSAIFTSDGEHLIVGGSTTNTMIVYKRSGDTFTKLPTPNVGATYAINNMAFSGNYLICAIASSPYIAIYKRNGDTYTKLTNPSTVPGSAVRGIACSPDGTHVILGLNTAPYLLIYKVDNTADTFTAISNPSTSPPGQVRKLKFSPDGTHLVVPSSSSPFLTIYERSGDTYTKLADPVQPPNGVYEVEFKSDGTKLFIAHNNPPYLTVYDRVGGTLTKQNVTVTVTPLNGNSIGGFYSIKQLFSDSSYIVTYEANKPFIRLLKRDDAGNYKDIITDYYLTQINGLTISDDSNYVAHAISSSPFINVFKREKNNTLTKLPNPSTLPYSTGYCAAFSPDGTHLAVGHAGSAVSLYISIFRRDGNTLTKLATPPGTTAAINRVAYSADSLYLAAGLSNDLVLYRRDGDTYSQLPAVDLRPGSSVYDLQFSPDGQYLACGQAGSPYASVYKKGTNDAFTRLPALSGFGGTSAKSLTFSPDGKYLAVGGGSTYGIMIFRVDAGGVFTKLTTVNTGNIGNVQSLRYSMGGQYLIATTSTAPFFRIYEVGNETLTEITPASAPILTYYANDLGVSKNIVTFATPSEFPYVSIFEWERFIKFLINDDTNIKKLVNGVWTTVGTDSDVYSKATFDTHGMTDISTITNAAMQLLTSSSPELVTWKGIEEGSTIPDVRIVDQLIPRILKQKDNIYVGGVDTFKITATEDGGIIRVALSDDNGVTWKGKSAVDIADAASFKSNGWTVTELNALTKANIQALTSKYKLKFAFYMEQVDVDKTLSISGFDVKTYEGWIPLGNVIPDGDAFTFSGLDNFSTIPVANFDAQFEVVAKKLNTVDPLDISVKSIAFGQLITPKGDIKIEDVINIDLFTLTSNKTGTAEVRVAVSFDSGTTWYGWNGSTFITLNINTEMKTKGITPTSFNAITSTQWQTLRGTSETVRFAYFLESANITDVAEIDKLAMQGDMKGMWKKAIHGTDYDYHYSGSSELRVDLMKDGSFKINY